MRQAAKAGLCFLFATLAIPGLWATTAVEHSETDLIQAAEVIVVGRVVDQASQWIDRDLVTVVTVEVSEVLKGNAGNTVAVVVPGGIDTNRPVPVAMTYPAAPELLGQENVLLFLTDENRLAGSYGIVGFSQGKFTVVESAQGEKVATQNLSQLNLQDRNGNVTRGAARSIPLSQLRQKIKATLDVEKQQ
jgi:hypothetical protein